MLCNIKAMHFGTVALAAVIIYLQREAAAYLLGKMIVSFELNRNKLG